MLNTPLIQEMWKGFSPVLEKYYRENGDFKAGGMSYSKMRDGVPILLNGILEGTRRISVIVKELKDFARPDDVNMNQQIDINAVVKGAVSLLQNSINKSTESFSVAHGEDIPELTGNFQRLEQVIINLIQNACQALPDKTKGIAITTSCDDHSVIVRVSDEGKGIPQEYLDQIMDPFFTTKQGSGGMGLGLSISQKIVIDHGGHIDVESTEGKGSTFTVILPITSAEKEI
jgi:signal transduction histidine kinase